LWDELKSGPILQSVNFYKFYKFYKVVIGFYVNLLGSVLWTQSSAKKWRFFFKTHVVIKLLQKLHRYKQYFDLKNANIFTDFYRRKYFKNHNIGPWH
jgi:hypothetical protein